MQNQLRNTNLTTEELKYELKKSLKMCKQLREAMKMKLKLWKTYYTAGDVKDYLQYSDALKKELEPYYMEIDFVFGTSIIVLRSTIDPEFEVAETFFDDMFSDIALEYKDKIREEYKQYVQNSKSKNTT